MKELFKLLILTLAPILLFTQCNKDPDADNPIYFSDNALLIALIEEGVDTNGDSIIQMSEAKEISTLDITRKRISDMSGIGSNRRPALCQNNFMKSPLS